MNVYSSTKKNVPKDMISSLAKEWEMIQNTPGDIRILIDNKIRSFPETYYDNDILNNMNYNWQRSSYIVGNMVANSPHLISCYWLLARIYYIWLI
ncbi:MAG: DUF3658 domain-containing protein [Rickettsia endosymbiont of Bryobia graminum]|nr:DUF3658 domain-containing protein [Rickettsia endosymbiont of Bryobia graminum]